MDKRKQATNNNLLYAELDSPFSKSVKKLIKEKWWNTKCDDIGRLEAINRHQEMHDIIIIKFLAERRWRPCSSTALCPASL